MRSALALVHENGDVAILDEAGVRRKLGEHSKVRKGNSLTDAGIPRSYRVSRRVRPQHAFDDVPSARRRLPHLSVAATLPQSARASTCSSCVRGT